MAVQDELAHPAAEAPIVETPLSPDWWQSRSSDELQAIVYRGEKAGDMFLAAASEMERRARDSEAARRAEQVQASETAGRRKKIALTVLLALALAAAVLVRVMGL